LLALLTLLVLSILLGGCPREVPVMAPVPPCPLPVLAPFPALHVAPCPGASTDLCMSVDSGRALFLWARDAQRWMVLATVCLAR
jgi:hypothetical protein